MKKNAEEFFHKKPENWNCAQAILKAYQEEFNISDFEIETFQAFGGGRAKDGICGALFAAEKLLQETKSGSIKKDFEKEVGSLFCKEIKAEKFPCADCVRIADELLKSSLGASFLTCAKTERTNRKISFGL